MTQSKQFREAILAASLDSSNFGETPQLETLYLPPHISKHLDWMHISLWVVEGWANRSGLRRCNPNCFGSS